MNLSSILKKVGEEKPTRSFVQIQPSAMHGEFIPIMFWRWCDDLNIADIYFNHDDRWCYLDEFNKWLSSEISDFNEEEVQDAGD